MIHLNLSLQLNSGDTLHIEADNLPELNAALTYLHNIGQIGTAQVIQQPVHPDGVPVRTVTDAQAAATLAADKAVEAKTEAPKPERKPRQKKDTTAAPVEKAEPEKSADADTGEKSAGADTVKVTAEDAAAAITEVANKLGLPAARNMLDIFKVKRVGELPADKYASFVKECNDLIGEPAATAEDDAGDLI